MRERGRLKPPEPLRDNNRTDGKETETMKKDGTKKERVFVYGTLLSGEHNDYFLDEAEFVGYGELVGEFKMFNLGAFPAVVREDGYLNEVKGEIYEVDSVTFKRLDSLESVDLFDPEDKDGTGTQLYYRRELNVAIEGDDGAEVVKAWVYLMRPERLWENDVIDSGSWRERDAA